MSLYFEKDENKQKEARFGPYWKNISQRTNKQIRGSFTAQPGPSLTGLDSSKQKNMLLFVCSHDADSQTSQTGETFEVSEEVNQIKWISLFDPPLVMAFTGVTNAHGPSPQSKACSSFLKNGQSRPLFVYFCSFHIPTQITNIQFEQYKLKKA